MSTTDRNPADELGPDDAKAVPSRPTIHTIAREAKVSIATVSYVLNGRHLTEDKIRIRPETSRRVLDAAERLGYRASGLARGMRRGQTDQVCLALTLLDSPWTLAMIDAINGTLRPHGYTTLLLVEQENWPDFLARQGADAAVIQADKLSQEELAQLDRLGRQGTAIIAVDCPQRPTAFDVVRQRDRPAMAGAVSALTERHDRIACLCRTEPDRSDTGSRYDLFREVLAAAGRTADPRLVRATGSNRYVAYRAALDLLDRPDRPTAIFGTTDLNAISALWAAYRLGLRVPEDLEIVGVGNSPEGLQTDPSLSSVGARSVFTDVANLLLARLQNDSDAPPERIHHSDWSIYWRGTTGADLTSPQPNHSGKEPS